MLQFPFTNVSMLAVSSLKHTCFVHRSYYDAFLMASFVNPLSLEKQLEIDLPRCTFVSSRHASALSFSEKLYCTQATMALPVTILHHSIRGCIVCNGSTRMNVHIKNNVCTIRKDLIVCPCDDLSVAWYHVDVTVIVKACDDFVEMVYDFL